MSEATEDLVRRLYEIVDELTSLHGRHFTPDGHLVGSLGEVLAATMFGLDLVDASTKGYDAKIGSKTVEIKATQGAVFALQADVDPLPDYVIALRIERDGSVDVVYNGPATKVWEVANLPAKNRQRRISVSRLRELQGEVAPEQRLTPLTEGNQQGET